jgi:hypothetical protein
LDHFRLITVSPFAVSPYSPSRKPLIFKALRQLFTGDGFHRFSDVSRHFSKVAFCFTVRYRRARPLKYQQPLRLHLRAA